MEASSEAEGYRMHEVHRIAQVCFESQTRFKTRNRALLCRARVLRKRKASWRWRWTGRLSRPKRSGASGNRRRSRYADCLFGCEYLLNVGVDMHCNLGMGV